MRLSMAGAGGLVNDDAIDPAQQLEKVDQRCWGRDAVLV